MDPMDRTQDVMETWDAVSAAWERHRDKVFAQTRPVSEWLIARVRPEPGDTILEIGAGPGETGFMVADRLRPEGRLISSDVSPGMVDAARRGSQRLGLSNVEHRVMDAQQLDLADSSVDGVISRFALMLIPDPARVCAEAHRVLRPGGRFAYAVWGAVERNPWVTVMIGALLENGHALPTRGGAADSPFAPGGLFSLATAEPNAAPLRAAGFVDVTAEELNGAMRFASVDEYWDVQTSLAGPVSKLLASLSPDQIGAVRASVEAAVAPFRNASGCDLPYVAMGVTANKP